MPTNVEDSDLAADEAAGADAAAREQQLGSILPQATEPLRPNVVNALGKVIGQTLTKIAGHKVDIPVQPISEAVEQIPADVGKQVLAIAAMNEKLGERVKELGPYRFDPMGLLTDNNGLREATKIIGAMGADQDLVMALRAPQGGESADEGQRADGDDGEGAGVDDATDG